MNKKILILMLGILLVSITHTTNVSAVGEINFCCEKTIDGAWCQNELESECDTSGNLRAVPTSCEATSFCKLGCCYDSQEGTCMENTPQIVCNEEGGVYSADSASCDIPQCSLGCCLIGEQASFVTQTRCKRLSSIYGLETNFRTDISNEFACIASATSSEKGACVFEKEFERTCRFLTQKECKELEVASEFEVEFHIDYLCSAESLGTNCGPSEKTTCIEEGDEVYFLETCGNLANIYDSQKQKNKEYWSKIQNKEESCGAESSNAGSSACGNCDYYIGSTCKQYEKSKDPVKPNHGDNICRDLGCKYEGEDYKHGETWCVSNSKAGETLPGSEYFRLVCYNGEVTVEPCASFRQERCIQDEINGFKTAACGANIWRDCIAQTDEKDCTNTDKRDCLWVNSGNLKPLEELQKDLDIDDIKEFFEKLDNNLVLDKYYQYVCVPLYSPGFDFWNSEGESEEMCSIASTECTAVFEKSVTGGKWDCKQNCHCCVNDDEHKGCTGSEWPENKDELCQALGDCGKKRNFQGVKGFEFEDPSFTVN